MPRRSASGTKGLIKHHRRGCKLRAGDPARCTCHWSGKYKQYDVVLYKWAGIEIDPRAKEKAKVVFGRMRAAIDNKTFDPTGERPVAGTDQTLALFIPEWKTHYADAHKLTANSLPSMLGVLERSRLGGMSLKALATGTETIEKWLNETADLREWVDGTWNDYHSLLNRLFKLAVQWGRMAKNPMTGIGQRVKVQPEHFKVRHLLEAEEARLFAACALLNRPGHKPNRNKLTQEKADAIRAALAAGEQGKAVAARFQVSPAVVSSIKHGDIWNPDKITPGTKGTEMERQLIGAFDCGLRKEEMELVQLSHVSPRLMTVTREDGTTRQGYLVTLPALNTKGGKTTGLGEQVFIGTPRGVAMVEARRFQLKNNKPSRTFLFGAQDGSRKRVSKRLERELFALAKLDWGRHNGLVWHTIRHEFVSRVLERTGDPVLAQAAARHKRLETTQQYLHARRDRVLAAFAG